MIKSALCSLGFLMSLAALQATHAAPAADTSQTAPENASYGPQLEGFRYPYPVKKYTFNSQGDELDMAYMDVRPTQPNGKVAVLLHGKNFCGATWETTIQTLVTNGYRVIAPDQIGFCKSEKPVRYQFSFHQLAQNTHNLLESLGITKAILVGHSTGGMLAVRYGLMYPLQTEQLVLVDPIGLEDWQAKGAPAISVDQWYNNELTVTTDKIRNYERNTYYAGDWKPQYETWVQMLGGMVSGPGRELVAWNSALVYDMIYSQPVVYELGGLKMPVVLMIGDKDTTAVGKQFAPPEIRPALGNYPLLAKAAMQMIPRGTLVEFPNAGHAPQIQDPVQFHQALLKNMLR